jgi:hypothetical protein
MSKPYMSASIVGINAFGTAITFPKPGIINYDGRELFVHAKNDGSTLTVKIDGTPSNEYSTVTARALPVAVDLEFLTVGAGPQSSAATPTSAGGPLMLTASVVPSADPYGTDAAGVPTTVTLNVVEAKNVPLNYTPVGYIVVQMDDGSATQLRWVQNPPQRKNSPQTANLIDNNPNTGGVAGPFGFDTP